MFKTAIACIRHTNTCVTRLYVIFYVVFSLLKYTSQGLFDHISFPINCSIKISHSFTFYLDAPKVFIFPIINNEPAKTQSF